MAQQEQSFKDYYHILRVSHNASPEDIKRAYRKRMKFFHPDYYQDEERRRIAETETKEINEAYEVLSDPERRKEYDFVWHLLNTAPSAFQAAMLCQEELEKTRNALADIEHQLHKSKRKNALLQDRLNKVAAQANEMATEAARWKELVEIQQTQIQSLKEEIQRYQPHSSKAEEEEESISQTEIQAPLLPQILPAPKSRLLLISNALTAAALILVTILLVTRQNTFVTQAHGSGAIETRTTSDIASRWVSSTPSPSPVIGISVLTTADQPGAGAVDVNPTPSSTPTEVRTVTVLSGLPSETTAPIRQKPTSANPTKTSTKAIVATATAVPTETLSAPPPATGLVFAEMLNVRSGPGKNYPVVLSLEKGASFVIRGKDKDEPSWWYVQLDNGINGWVAADPGLVLATVNTALSIVPAPPTPQATLPRVISPTPPAGNARAQQKTPTALRGRWVLIADSAADFPDSRPERQWWYLFSDGRDNFHWREMGRDEWGCERAPGEHLGRICADRMTTDTHGDIALQWKARRGGRYLLEWDAKIIGGAGTLNVYKHARQIASQGRGLSLPNSYTEDLIDWEMFFFVLRASSYGNPPDATLHVRVYRWIESTE